MAITKQPEELQSTAAPKFGVADSALANGEVRFNLMSSYVGHQDRLFSSDAIELLSYSIVYLEIPVTLKISHCRRNFKI